MPRPRDQTLHKEAEEAVFEFQEKINLGCRNMLAWRDFEAEMLDNAWLRDICKPFLEHFLDDDPSVGRGRTYSSIGQPLRIPTCAFILWAKMHRVPWFGTTALTEWDGVWYQCLIEAMGCWAPFLYALVSLSFELPLRLVGDEVVAKSDIEEASPEEKDRNPCKRTQVFSDAEFERDVNQPSFELASEHHKVLRDMFNLLLKVPPGLRDAASIERAVAAVTKFKMCARWPASEDCESDLEPSEASSHLQLSRISSPSQSRVLSDDFSHHSEEDGMSRMSHDESSYRQSLRPIRSRRSAPDDGLHEPVDLFSRHHPPSPRDSDRDRRFMSRLPPAVSRRQVSRERRRPAAPSESPSEASGFGTDFTQADYSASGGRALQRSSGRRRGSVESEEGIADWYSNERGSEEGSVASGPIIGGGGPHPRPYASPEACQGCGRTGRRCRCGRGSFGGRGASRAGYSQWD